MNIEAVSAAGTVALTTTIAFLLIARSWNVISRTVDNGSSFADSIMHEAAQRFRDELDRLSASQSIYLGAILVFAMLFAAAYVLQAQALFAGYPDWQIGLQLAFLLLTVVFAAYKVIRTIHASRHVRFLRDASLAIGHQLQQMSSLTTQVFHDVKTAAGVIDHVVVGREGVFAVNVVARRPRNGGSVCILDNGLRFSNCDGSISVVPQLAKNARLGKHLARLIGQRVRVRSVIAVPGWETPEQSDERHLVTNERNVSMLLGWKDRTDYLMDDDMSAVKEDLRSRCRQRTRDKSGSGI